MIRNENFSVAIVARALAAAGVDYTIVNAAELDGLRFCSLFAPEPAGIYFFEGERFPLQDVATSVVLCAQPLDAPCVQFIVRDPQAAYYRLMQQIFGAAPRETGIHPSAVVSPDARIGADTYIGPFCVIGAAEIGRGVRLTSHVVVHDHCIVEDDVTIEAHSTVGATGVAWAWDAATGERIVQPQIGSARVGKGSFLGTDVTVVRGSINEVTQLGDHCVVAHGSKIGHGAVVGRHVHFANNVSLAGNVRVADRVFLGSACVLRPKVKVAEDVVVGAGAVVTGDITERGVVVAGVPARALPAKERHTGVPRSFASTVETQHV